LLNKADDIQSGETSLKDTVGDLVDDVIGNKDIDSSNNDISSELPESTTPPAPVQPEPVIEVEPHESDEDEGISDEEALAKLNKFKKGG